MTVRIEINDLHMLNANELRNLIGYLSNTLDDALSIPDSANEIDSEEESIVIKDNLNMFAPNVATSATFEVEQKPIRGNYLAAVDLELDSEGLPWDKRIHSMNKTKTKNGAWKLARNMTDAEASKVKAELRKVAELQKELRIVDEPIVPPAVEAPVKETPVVSTAEQFQKFIAKLLNLQKNNIVKAEDITNILRTLGLNTIVELSYRPELISSADVMLENIVNYEGGDDE